jgi:NADPH2:quinone reductase
VGCDVAIDYSHGDWVKQVRDATDGRGVSVVYDAVGKDTFLGSLDCAQTFGMVVLYGGASARHLPSSRSCSTRRAACT